MFAVMLLTEKLFLNSDYIKVDNVYNSLTGFIINCYNIYIGLLMFINMEYKYITIKQAAKILGVSALTLRNWDNSGKFEASRHPISNYRVYKIEDIENILISIEQSKGKKKPSKGEVRKLIVKSLGDDEIYE